MRSVGMREPWTSMSIRRRMAYGIAEVVRPKFDSRAGSRGSGTSDRTALASTKKRIFNPLQAETEPHRDGVARIVPRACLSRWAWLCNCGDCSTVSYYRLRQPRDEAAAHHFPDRYNQHGRCPLGLARSEESR